MPRRLRTAAAMVLAPLALAGCGIFGIGNTSSGTCVDWVVFDTPQDAAAEAGAVVIGRVTGLDATTRLYDLDVNVWNVEVDRVVQGSTAGDEIRVISSPRTCEAGSPYPRGDPLDTDDDVMLFLGTNEGDLRTITGYQGVIPAPADGAVPDVWTGDAAEFVPDGAL